MKFSEEKKIAVVIPAYRVRKHILGVINGIGPEISKILVVDDSCPEFSGEYVQEKCGDPRVVVIKNLVNLGVGGAVMVGYRAAVDLKMHVVVKVDGDGQMKTSDIHRLIAPILDGRADYTKGNRFYDLRNISNMPLVRIIGNSVLSLMTKISSGYWNIFDPTNGFTAISAPLIGYLPLEKISNRYFFETDMLFRLNTLRSVVHDIPMDAIYGDEISNLKIRSIFLEFLIKHITNFFKRVFYNYFLRDMSIASIEIIIGLFLFTFGIIYGSHNWWRSIDSGIPAATGVIMISTVTLLIGLQLILAFIAFDISNTPKIPVGRVLPKVGE
jgi:dolichol-phosphate mannosyltransferase